MCLSGLVDELDVLSGEGEETSGIVQQVGFDVKKRR